MSKETGKEQNVVLKALVAAQSELTNLDKNASGYGYKYTDLATLITCVKPILAKHKLGFTQQISSIMVEGLTHACVKTIVFHEDGDLLDTVITAPPVEKMSAIQGLGATITYLRRYSLQAILGLASEDDDAKPDTPKKEGVKPKSGSKSQPKTTNSL